MKNRVIWIMFMVVALVASGAWAVFNPNGTNDSLKFNLNFENNHDPCTIDAGPSHLWGHRSCLDNRQDHSGEANTTPVDSGTI